MAQSQSPFEPARRKKFRFQGCRGVPGGTPKRPKLDDMLERELAALAAQDQLRQDS